MLATVVVVSVLSGNLVTGCLFWRPRRGHAVPAARRPRRYRDLWQRVT
jgi:hypothetical protein